MARGLRELKADCEDVVRNDSRSVHRSGPPDRRPGNRRAGSSTGPSASRRRAGARTAPPAGAEQVIGRSRLAAWICGPPKGRIAERTRSRQATTRAEIVETCIEVRGSDDELAGRRRLLPARTSPEGWSSRSGSTEKSTRGMLSIAPGPALGRSRDAPARETVPRHARLGRYRRGADRTAQGLRERRNEGADASAPKG